MLFAGAGLPAPHANLLRFHLGQRSGVTMSVQAKRPGQGLTAQAVDLDVDFEDALGRVQEAYERLLEDAIDGNPTRFARQDGVEAAWRVIQPALDDPGEVFPYERGTWGPAEIGDVLSGQHWHAPTVLH